MTERGFAAVRAERLSLSVKFHQICEAAPRAKLNIEAQPQAK